MKNFQKWRAYLPLMIGSFAVILFSTAGITAIMGWRPVSTGRSDNGFAHESSRAAAAVALPEAKIAPNRAKAHAHKRCATCGQVISITDISGQDDGFGIDRESRVTDDSAIEHEANPAIRQNIVVRMTNGSTLVLDNVSAAGWRVGERVIVIAGTLPLHK
mgnify:CR=1 FL=1